VNWRPTRSVSNVLVEDWKMRLWTMTSSSSRWGKRRLSMVSSGWRMRFWVGQAEETLSAEYQQQQQLEEE
jgi:hypothetical protein